jgi:hypothetical protein
MNVDNPTPQSDATQAMQTIKEKTSHTWIFSRMGNLFLWLFEIACYLSVVIIVYIAIRLPDGSLSIPVQMNEADRVNIMVEEGRLKEIMQLVKTVVGLLGFLMLIPGVLFRKVRKKNNLLEEVNGISVAYLKSQQRIVK